MNVKTNKSGFTLTEILIVLVVAGILLALILPNAAKALSKSNIVSKDAAVKSCNAALVMCYGESNKDWAKCKDSADLITAKVIKTAFDAEQVKFTGDSKDGYICEPK